MKWSGTWLCIHTDIGTNQNRACSAKFVVWEKSVDKAVKKKTSVGADTFLGINFFPGYRELLRGDIIGLLPGSSVQG